MGMHVSEMERISLDMPELRVENFAKPGKKITIFQFIAHVVQFDWDFGGALGDEVAMWN